MHKHALFAEISKSINIMMFSQLPRLATGRAAVPKGHSHRTQAEWSADTSTVSAAHSESVAAAEEGAYTWNSEVLY